ncbi:MAG: hypothetical protein ABFC54_03145, partial [Thermoguttaceae bacterium]
MKRPLSVGYTLIEILVATVLSLLLLGAVVRMFGDVGRGITDSRSLLESADRLRLAAMRLQQDLAGVTVTMSPPRKPENNEGYFEYIEGPVGSMGTVSSAMTQPYQVAQNAVDFSPAQPDRTIGDFDDILMFTTRSVGRPFVGKYYDTVKAQVVSMQSEVAEVAWFLRGRTLHRRVLLVSPSLTVSPVAAGFYRNNDISVHWDGAKVVPNTLGDLTERVNRYAHPTNFPANYNAYWPWRITSSGTRWFPTLPTLSECSGTTSGGTLWAINQTTTSTATSGSLDFWSNVGGTNWLTDYALSSGTGTRIADDVILTNVIGFDVKAWDPTANNNLGAYVDLGYQNAAYAAANANTFRHLGGTNSGIAETTTGCARVYDTYSTSLESTAGSDGFDSNNDGIVDDDDEKVQTVGGVRYGQPSYPIPLRGIQVKIRVF